MNAGVLGMLREWRKEGDSASILLFFRDKCGFGEDYAGFLFREVERGNL